MINRVLKGIIEITKDLDNKINKQIVKIDEELSEKIWRYALGLAVVSLFPFRLIREQPVFSIGFIFFTYIFVVSFSNKYIFLCYKLIMRFTPPVNLHFVNRQEDIIPLENLVSFFKTRQYTGLLFGGVIIVELLKYNIPMVYRIIYILNCNFRFFSCITK